MHEQHSAKMKSSQTINRRVALYRIKFQKKLQAYRKQSQVPSDGSIHGVVIMSHHSATLTDSSGKMGNYVGTIRFALISHIRTKHVIEVLMVPTSKLSILFVIRTIPYHPF